MYDTHFIYCYPRYHYSCTDCGCQQVNVQAGTAKCAEAVAQGYGSVDSIKMFGGDASNLSGNIVTTMTQITDGLKESSGIDLNSVLAGFLGGKMAQDKETVLHVELPEVSSGNQETVTE